MQATSLDALIELAKKIISTEEDSPNLSDCIQEYAECFDAWFQSADTQELGNLNADELTVLHGEVVKRAEIMLRSLGVQRRELKNKAAGLIRYIDVLPQRISSIRS